MNLHRVLLRHVPAVFILLAFSSVNAEMLSPKFQDEQNQTQQIISDFQNLPDDLPNNLWFVELAAKSEVAYLQNQKISQSQHMGKRLASNNGSFVKFQKTIQVQQNSFIKKAYEQGLINDVQRRFSRLTNSVIVEADNNKIAQLKQLPYVKSVTKAGYYVPALWDSLYYTGGWDIQRMKDASGNDVKGHGITVAILDTGIDYNHEELGGCFGEDCKVIGGYDFVNDDDDPSEVEAEDHRWTGHGTMVAGIVAANGPKMRGMAPEATILAYKVCGGHGCYSGDILSGLEALLDPDGDPETDDSPRVVNLSLGSPNDNNDVLKTALNNLIDSGVVVVTSSGNNGTWHSIGSIAAVERVITVGAADHKFDEVTSFSSYGPTTFEGALKPDLVAPGAFISAPHFSNSSGSGYAGINGTSGAAPHVAGAAALMLQLFPDETPEKIKSRLVHSARRLANTSTLRQGAGVLSLFDTPKMSILASPVSLTFGEVDLSAENFEIRREIVLYNMSEEDQDVSLGIDGDFPAGISLELPEGNSAHIPANSDIIITVSFSFEASLYNPQEVDSIIEDWRLTITGGDNDIVIPLVLSNLNDIVITPEDNTIQRWEMNIYNQNHPELSRYVTNTDGQLPKLPVGTYNAVWAAEYADATRIAFEENITIGTQTKATTNFDMANQIIAVPEVYDANGQVDLVPLTSKFNLQFLDEQVKYQYVVGETWNVSENIRGIDVNLHEKPLYLPSDLNDYNVTVMGLIGLSEQDTPDANFLQINKSFDGELEPQAWQIQLDETQSVVFKFGRPEFSDTSIDLWTSASSVFKRLKEYTVASNDTKLGGDIYKSYGVGLLHNYGSSLTENPNDIASQSVYVFSDPIPSNSHSPTLATSYLINDYIKTFEDYHLDENGDIAITDTNIIDGTHTLRNILANQIFELDANPMIHLDHNANLDNVDEYNVNKHFTIFGNTKDQFNWLRHIRDIEGEFSLSVAGDVSTHYGFRGFKKESLNLSNGDEVIHTGTWPVNMRDAVYHSTQTLTIESQAQATQVSTPNYIYFTDSKGKILREIEDDRFVVNVFVDDVEDLQDVSIELKQNYWWQQPEKVTVIEDVFAGQIRYAAEFSAPDAGAAAHLRVITTESDGQTVTLLAGQLMAGKSLTEAFESDFDEDGIPDYKDDDDDNDGYVDLEDAWVLDATQWQHVVDTDNDGVPDDEDAFPLDATEWLDTDGDGIGNNADEDDDNDGFNDDEDTFPLDPEEWLDSDGDGIGDNGDRFPLDPEEWLDSDGDGIGDNADKFPFNAALPAVAFDYDGDKISDVIVRNKVEAMQYILSSSNGQILRKKFGLSQNDIPVAGDFDGDGIFDVAFRRPSNFTWYIRNSSDNKIQRIRFGLNELDIPVPADYDGDGTTDVAVLRYSDKKWYILRSSDNYIVRQSVTVENGDIPVPADYDGDGLTDIAFKKADSNEWNILMSIDQTWQIHEFGPSIDSIPVPADYDGDGKADLAYRIPETHGWYIQYSSDMSIIERTFGLQAEDIPVVADYDGDGKADIAVRRPSNHMQYIRYSSDDSIGRIRFGLNSEYIPLASPVFTRMSMAGDH